jgi:peptidoglycan/LPS O-acetylase OafA/YrhL
LNPLKQYGKSLHLNIKGKISLTNLTVPEIFSGYIPILDALRGVSILFVVFSHVAFSNNSPVWLNRLGNFIKVGNLGVQIFFFISGFLITGLLLKEKVKFGEINLRMFYWRRFLRIFPVFYIFLLFVFIASCTKFSTPIDSKSFLGPLLYISNFTYGEYNAGWFLGHSWSLSIEEQFYFIWPFLLVFFSNFRNIYFYLFLIAHILIKVIYYKNPMIGRILLGPFMEYAPLLLSGAILAFISFTNSDILKRALKKIKLSFNFIFFIVILFVEYLSGHGKFAIILLPFGKVITSTALFFILGYILFVSNKLKTLLKNGVLIFIGKVSYSWYIWQEIFLTQSKDYFFSANFSILNIFPYNIICSFVVAVLSYFIVEKYFLQFKYSLNKSGVLLTK